MKKATRLTILAVCIILFFIFTPYIVLYSMGYRLDFANIKILATGGIYVRSYPQADQIIIDSKIDGKPGMFLNAFFVQNLAPQNHTLLVKKPGYFSYGKNVSVIENHVTKLENILLIKENLSFDLLAEKTDYFSLSSDKKYILVSEYSQESLALEYLQLSSPGLKKNYSVLLKNTEILDTTWADNSNIALIKIKNASDVSYYIFDPSSAKTVLAAVPYLDKNSTQIYFDGAQIYYVENQTLYYLKNTKVTALIKDIAAYKILDNKILALSSDGLLLEYDVLGKLLQNITTKKFLLYKNKSYKLSVEFQRTFLETNDSLYLFDPDKEAFADFYSPIENYEILFAPDGKNLILSNSNEIYLYSFEEKLYKKLFSGEKIKNCQWLNNDYIIFEDNKTIKISEIDYRGNINIVSLPPDNPSQIAFNRQDGKLYVLAEKQLIFSEKITQ
ncbi:MAG: hypothetical protein A2402_00520 [Candidatus Staskawiczbacteria bacterium RIFOXYC1_FULL_37_43]|nr:MAG: hypothetical protein A2813_00930 [Candidatus Staskawiczbacteria bacterium RIFCSPHIGHO2_01_FULL_37_17]OGZ72343.1 MAG: hypothetical protein A2891_03700 [Candidatus Staskawiczbacteria bacterium RIFCSPLOWO2_01_FULL_37_19]OGZ76107.1 MAG: hypothetical protein A2205_03590 [Candidatus Staskawiczbacteria bacterium RIFOXYA1_FULL_37_15]OGZ76465.1 MAG: hypothetical protein A2280_00010 [Candidatus Staskawiczbacteria bacterium RIFOXYA12_FULL_37_10]OGZ80074.1 MAG: hypothetical protein A2353_02310 [Can